MDIIASSFFPAYFHLTGAVFCTSVGIDWFAGYFSWCVWSGASFNCIVLALNRIVEMIPFADGFRFLFEGRALLLWMTLSVAYMIVLPFVNRSHPYNTVVAAYI
uniref:AA_permease domain-containing protein n=1 Tax=Haemonchus contortus TaxID=6289 RepID=A0A7I4Z1W0_HAECO